MKHLGLSLLILCSCHTRTPGPVERSQAELGTAAAQITPAYLREQVARIASDDTQGRAPATPGDTLARHLLAEQLRGLGLQPGRGADGWEQPVELVSLTTALPKEWTFESGAAALPLHWSDDFIAGSGAPANGELRDAEVVFVGYGIEAPEYGWDDFKDQDVRGKVLLMLNNDPDWDPALFAGSTRLYYGRWTYKFESAARHGAAAALIIHTTPSAGYPFTVVQSSWGGPRFDLPSQGEPALTLEGWLSEDAARKLTQLSGHDLNELIEQARSKAFTPVSLGTTTSLRFETEVAHVPTANVFGLIPGSDAKLASEVVVVNAHHDHFGVGKPDEHGDTIYNGALDNGAGVAQVLAITRALKALPRPPRRSVAVLFVAAEEQGLLGSRYFAQHPPFPAGRIAAVVNYDGGNNWGPARDITQIGRGKSNLDAVVDRIAREQGRRVEPDQFPDRGSFYRSDQFNFAKIGVPALYLKPGLDVIGQAPGWGREQVLDYEAHRYHQPSDQLTEAWNFDGMVEDARFGFLATLAIADAEELPAWTPGDEFEAARKAALTR